MIDQRKQTESVPTSARRWRLLTGESCPASSITASTHDLNGEAATVEFAFAGAVTIDDDGGDSYAEVVVAGPVDRPPRHMVEYRRVNPTDFRPSVSGGGVVPGVFDRAHEFSGGRVALDRRRLGFPVRTRLCDAIEGLERRLDGLLAVLTAHPFDGYRSAHAQPIGPGPV